MSRASEKALSDLHAKLASTLNSALDNTETAQYLLDQYAEDLPVEVTVFLRNMSVMNPALLTVVSRFLKDNNIVAKIEDNADVDSLAKRLENKAKAKQALPVQEDLFAELTNQLH